MKAIVFVSLLWPIGVWGQSDSTLKPIQFREAVSGYGKYIHGTQVYSYDGIDVDNPSQTLRQYILAVKDSNATREYHLFEQDTEKRKAQLTTFWVSFAVGTVEIIVGAIQNATYKNALRQQQNAYYSSLSVTPMLPTTPKPTTPVCACMCWTGLSNSNGVTVYTCGSDYTIQTTNPYGNTTTTTPAVITPVPSRPTSAPTSVDLPTGAGWVAAGLCTYVLGTIIAASGSGQLNPSLHFLRSVQYYNRALGRKVSWQLVPTGGLNYTGLRLVGRF